MEVYANFRDKNRIQRSERWSSEIVKRARIANKRREICPVRFLGTRGRSTVWTWIGRLIIRMNIFVQQITKMPFSSNPYSFKLVCVISHVLADRFTWNLEEFFTGCTFIVWTTMFFFCFFFTTQRAKNTRKIDILNFKRLSFF